MRPLVTSALVLVAACHRDDARSCPPLAPAWSRATVATSLSSAPWASLTLVAIDDYARRWQLSYREQCASEVARRCLARGLDRFEALTTQLASSLDETARARAPLAVASLPDPIECDRLPEAELAMPSAAPDRARTEMFEHDLAQAWAAFAIGRTTAARTIVASDMLGLSKLGLARLTAETLSLASSIEHQAGYLNASRDHFNQALTAAHGANAPALVGRVWLAHVLDEPSAATLDQHTRAYAARPSPLEIAELARLTVARRADDAAITELQHGRDYILSIVGDRHPELATYENLLAAAERTRGHLRAALLHSDRALRADPGPSSLLTRAATYLEAGDIANARADATRARELLGGTGDTAAELAATRDANRLLGDIVAANGYSDEAAAYYQLAGVPPTPAPALPTDAAVLAARAKALPNEPSRTALATWIALAHATTGDEATRAARAAIALYQAMPQLGRGPEYDAMLALSKSP